MFNLVAILKALSDENRLKIISLIGNSEICACKLLAELDISQSTLSHHMKILSNCGLINTRKDGKWSHYSLNTETVELLKDNLHNLFIF